MVGNEGIDTTEFGLTKKSDFYRCSYSECFRLIAHNYMQGYAKPMPNTERTTALSLILRRPLDFKKPVTDLGI